MQQKSRRQFVTASLAGLPMLAYASAAAPAASASQAAVRAQGGSVLVDPVLDQTITTLRELVAEGEAKPASRKASARAIEATLVCRGAHANLRLHS